MCRDEQQDRLAEQILFMSADERKCVGQEVLSEVFPPWDGNEGLYSFLKIYTQFGSRVVVDSRNGKKENIFFSSSIGRENILSWYINRSW